MQKIKNKINRFKGDYFFLSNFWIYDKISVEHKYQASKTTDKAWYQAIITASSPSVAKKLGRRCPIIQNFDDVKDDNMLKFLREKFSYPELASLLVETGNVYLEEGNTWHDQYWGVCYCGICDSSKGLNKLGKLLMKVRAEINKTKERNDR